MAATLPSLQAQKKALRKAISETIRLLPVSTLAEQCKHDKRGLYSIPRLMMGHATKLLSLQRGLSPRVFYHCRPSNYAGL